MKKEISRFAESAVFEGMTSISALLAAKEAGVNDRPIEEILFDETKIEKKPKEWAFLRAKCRQHGIALRAADAETEILPLCVGNTHGGVIARCGERTLPALSEKDLPENGFLCYIEGIEDPYNFGYAIRSLYAAGCDAILLGERNWMSAAGVVARASAGASEALPVFAGDAAAALNAARARGYRIVAAGIRDSVSMIDAALQKPLVLLVGGEKRGLSASLLSLSDEVVRIDYGRDFRGSLSAASAATVLGFEVYRKNRK